MDKTFKKPLIGTVMSIGASQVSEIISIAGFDWVMIDMEHSTLSLDSVQNALQVMGEGILKIVRVPGNDEIWIKRVLDTGCDGIIVPMVNTAEEARRVVRSSKYPLDGKRSVGLSRAHKYGAGFKEYVDEANSDIVIMIQIEHVDGVKNIDEILEVKGLDSVFIGPFDLSASMGLTGQVSHPEVVSVINIIKKKCLKAGIPYGIFGTNTDTIISELNDGCIFPLFGVDSSTLLDSYTNSLKIIRKG